MLEIIQWALLYAVTIYFGLMGAVWVVGVLFTVFAFSATKLEAADSKGVIKVFVHLFIGTLWFGLFFSMVGFIIP